MKLRSRWEGELPQLGEVLKTPGPKARCAYVIVGIRPHAPPRVTLEVERIMISETERGVDWWLRDVERRVEARVEVRPCRECGSRQLCEPECNLAPWSLEP